MPVNISYAIRTEQDANNKVFVLPCVTGCGREIRVTSGYASIASGKCRRCVQIKRDPVASSFYELQKEALRRGVPLTLTLDDFKELTQQHSCTYCSRAVIWSRRASNLDRKDSTQGYTIANVVVCCKECNRLKGALYTYEEMLQIGALIRTFTTPRQINPKCGRSGARWINKGGKGKQVTSDELDQYLLEGWSLGRAKAHVY
jgi:hypothetical protein